MKALFLGVLLAAVSQARVTNDIPGQNDAFCAGAKGSESCIDKSGNVLATTDNTETLGTSALRWNALYLGTGGLCYSATSCQTGSTWLNSGTNIYNVAGSNVGIGTTSPGALLHILGNGSLGNQIRLDAPSGQYTESDWDNGGAQKGTIFWDNNNNVFQMQTAVATSSIAFAINGSAKMLIDHSGNVGIGTTSPLYGLDVSTTAAITGHLDARNDGTTAGTCTNGTLNSNSTSMAGEITISGGAGTCVINYGSPFKNTPFCIAQWGNTQAGSTAGVPYITPGSATSMTLNYPNCGGCTIHWICIGYR